MTHILYHLNIKLFVMNIMTIEKLTFLISRYNNNSYTFSFTVSNIFSYEIFIFYFFYSIYSMSIDFKSIFILFAFYTRIIK